MAGNFSGRIFFSQRTRTILAFDSVDPPRCSSLRLIALSVGKFSIASPASALRAMTGSSRRQKPNQPSSRTVEDRPTVIIRLDVHRRLSAEPGAYSGATADVFAVDGIACKVFRVFGVAHSPEGVRARFESEVEAYRRAALDPWLALHVARFYGRRIVTDVIEEDGTSIASLYALECCYQMELLEGNEKKFTALGLRQSFKHLQTAQDRFAEIGIDVLDASVFDAENAEAFKLIDFRLREPSDIRESGSSLGNRTTGFESGSRGLQV